jgi:hypothetical protein
VSRFARKVDRSQPGIVAALEAAGCKVLDLSWVGRGVPDLHVVCPRGFLHWLEVKTPPDTKKPRTEYWVPPESEFTEAEIQMRRVIPIKVVTCPQQALEKVGLAVAA